jgi:hypothetical protein
MANRLCGPKIRGGLVGGDIYALVPMPKLFDKGLYAFVGTLATNAGYRFAGTMPCMW